MFTPTREILRLRSQSVNSFQTSFSQYVLYRSAGRTQEFTGASNRLHRLNSKNYLKLKLILFNLITQRRVPLLRGNETFANERNFL